MELNRIYNEDNISLISRMPDDFIDLTVTSPPYDNLRDYKGYTFDFEALAKELYRVTKPGGVVVWIVGDATINGSETGTSFRQALKFIDVGFNLHDTMIWNKGSCPFPDKTRYYQSFEYMFIFSKGEIFKFNPISDRKNKWGGSKVHGTLRQKNGDLVRPTGMKSGRLVKEYGCRFNVWEQAPERDNTTTHPAPFPLQLIKDHIISWSDKSDIVFDPFMGSGTTAVAALDVGRRYIGAEIAKEYVEIANERIKNHTTQTDIFDVLEGN